MCSSNDSTLIEMFTNILRDSQKLKKRLHKHGLPYLAMHYLRYEPPPEANCSAVRLLLNMFYSKIETIKTLLTTAVVGCFYVLGVKFVFNDRKESLHVSRHRSNVDCIFSRDGSLHGLWWLINTAAVTVTYLRPSHPAAINKPLQSNPIQ